MGVSISDLGDEEHIVFCNWWNWRPTLDLIARAVDVDRAELERMSFSGGGGRLTEPQAKALAADLRANVLPAIPAGGRVLHDGTPSSSHDDGTFHREELEKNYSASRAWLEEFADFCERCSGFEVL